MTSEIKLDERFKVTPKIVKELEKLRKEKHSLRKIAQMYNLSTSTIKYWTDDIYRGKQRKRNALRKCTTERRVKAKNKQNAKYTWEYAVGYIAKMVYSEKHKKNPSNILGLPWQYWDTYLGHEWKKGELKIK